MKFTKESIIGEVVRSNPKATEIFEKKGLTCYSCPVASMEKLEQAAKMHGLNVDDLIEELNKALA